MKGFVEGRGFVEGLSPRERTFPGERRSPRGNRLGDRYLSVFSNFNEAEFMQ